MDRKDVISKRELEIKTIKDQLAGVRKKLENLQKTEKALLTGLKRAEESLERNKELYAKE